MQQTKYYCDECQQEVDEQSDLYSLKMALHGKLNVLVTDQKDICKSCVESLGYDFKDSRLQKYSFGEGFLGKVNSFF